MKKGKTIEIGEDAIADMTAEEAWEIAKKLFSEYKDSELNEIFGKDWSYPKLMELTPQEIKSKIKEWEAAKEIKVGDVVERDKEYGVVTSLDHEEWFRTVLFRNGETGVYNQKTLKKTGRHIDIEGLLKQIGGDE